MRPSPLSSSSSLQIRSYPTKESATAPTPEPASEADTITGPAQPLSVRASHTTSSAVPVVAAMSSVRIPLVNRPREVVTLMGAWVAPSTWMMTTLLPSAFTPLVTPGTAPAPRLSVMASLVVSEDPHAPTVATAPTVSNTLVHRRIDTSPASSYRVCVDGGTVDEMSPHATLLDRPASAWVTSAVSESRIWLRTARFDLGLQLGALVGIAPPLLIYAAYDPGRASSLLPLVSLIAIPFLHVFGSFFFAFSSRNRSPSPPRRLAIQWGIWAAAVVALLAYAPRGLATFALLYGGWHILRQNFGFLRELAHRGGVAKDPTLRRLDLAACIAPAVALWLFIAERGPWHFMGADVHHLTVPTWLLALAFAAVPATALLREHRLAGNRTSAAGLLLLLGNAAALLGPALFLDDLTLIYTLSASFHGIQYLAYLGERERADNPAEHPTRVLVPLVSAIVLSMIGWFAASLLLLWVLPAAGAVTWIRP